MLSLPELRKTVIDLKNEILDLKKTYKGALETSKEHQERIRDALGTVPILHQKGKAKEVPMPRSQEDLVIDILKAVK